MLKFSGGILLLILFFMVGGATFNHYRTKDLETEKVIAAKNLETQALEQTIQAERFANESLTRENADYEQQVSSLAALVKEKDKTITLTQKANTELQQRLTIAQDSVLKLLQFFNKCSSEHRILTADLEIAMINLDDKMATINKLQKDKQLLEEQLIRIQAKESQPSPTSKAPLFVSNHQNSGDELPLSPPNYFALALFVSCTLIFLWRWFKSKTLFYKTPNL